jgi:hypothetical protein
VSEWYVDGSLAFKLLTPFYDIWLVSQWKYSYHMVGYSLVQWFQIFLVTRLPSGVFPLVAGFNPL